MFGGKEFSPNAELPDLFRKVILVTGGNTGLGEQTALQLAKLKSAVVCLAARIASKVRAAIANIKVVVPGAQRFLVS